jgi:phosphatidate cytidylyltransferase
VALGAGSALGDLTNSYVKRKLAIDEWGRAIPGHGGILDRFSSMAGSAVLVFYFLLIVQP